MPDERYTFETARIRLEEIAAEVRKKDTSLEKSLDLLEEGVRLANICTELVDHTDLSATVTESVPDAAAASAGDAAVAESDGQDVGHADAADVGPLEDDPADAADGSAVSGSADDGEAGDAEVEGPAFDEMDDDLHEPGESGDED